MTRDVWSILYFVLNPTNAQLSHKLSHSYMFRHYRVNLMELVINEDDTIVSKHDVHESVHRDTIMKVTNKMQLYRLIYYS